MKHRYSLFIAVTTLIITSLASQAEIPAGYYTSLNGKKDAELKNAIHELVSHFTLVSSYSNLPQYFAVTDVYPDQTNYSGNHRWWDMYSDMPLYAPSFKGLNREHSFPKSWWGGLTTVSAYVDLNHLYPSEAAANMAKSNYPLGELNTGYAASFDNGVTRVGYPKTGQGGGAKFVFEPDDEYKGDFARTYFYMVTCYQDLTWKYFYMVNQNTYPTLNAWSVDLLLRWHRQDPVSQKEIDRNEAVYSFQNNRNPFIDYPELAEYIWGVKVGENFSPGSVDIPNGDPTLIVPTQGMNLDFGQVALGQSVTRSLFFSGENLIGSLDVVLSQGDKKMFKLATSTISAQLVNSADGYNLNITYTPTELGEHNTKIIVSEGGITGSRGVTLRGECLPVPTLTACTATSPSDIQSDRYTANWTSPENEVVDYYVVTVTHYTGANAVSEELLAEENQLVVEDFDLYDHDTYSVQSVRLGYRSPASNVVFVEHSGVTGVTYDQPLVVQGLEGCIRIICSAPQTGCRIYNAAGMLVESRDTVELNTDIDLPLGVYIVVTDQHATPVKVAVK